MILMIDNYDSFTYNLYQYMSELGVEVKVVRNDKITLDEIEVLSPSKIVISPGPCTPDKAGISTDLISKFGSTIPILGVCLGHQCIGQAYGGIVGGAGEIMHGKTSLVNHTGEGLFKGIPNPFKAIRYHSLMIYKDTLPEELEVTAWTDNDIVMGVKHKSDPVQGIQFHPESIMTEFGKEILSNFIFDNTDKG
ncbi:MAG: anthranilate/aminodeoxychorismate synthase component II [Chloroflexi bacterium]|nr:anthranilate/aminodeoxychorismate synthase component II [Chloroflexota bacterium]|tara:strand:+ start:898 stop:1476 length:579 start_codon:yes stop_codon:yes gene_type:complete